MLTFNRPRKRGICASCRKKTIVYPGEIARKGRDSIIIPVCSRCWSKNLGPCIKGWKVVRKHRWKSTIKKGRLQARLPKRTLKRMKALECKDNSVWFYCLRCDGFLV